MMLCEKCFRPFSKRSEGMSRFTATLAYTRSFCEFVGVWTVNIFSSVNHVLANLALRLVVETDVCRMEHLHIVHKNSSRSSRHWRTRKLATEQSGFESRRLFDLSTGREFEILNTWKKSWPHAGTKSARTLSTGLLDSFASDYPWLSQQTEDILNITLTEISFALRKF